MLDRGVGVAPLDEGTTLLLADPSLVAASIVARLPETLCCCPPVVPTKKMIQNPNATIVGRAVGATRERSSASVGLIEPASFDFTANTAILRGEANSRRQPASGGCTGGYRRLVDLS